MANKEKSGCEDGEDGRGVVGGEGWEGGTERNSRLFFIKSETASAR